MPFTAAESAIFGAMFGDPEAAAIFSDEALVRLWCQVEGALAEAEASFGIIPQEMAHRIAMCTASAEIDLARLGAGTNLVGYPILPLIEILEEEIGPEAGAYLHWGATTQDIMDSALALQMVKLHQLIERHLGTLTERLAEAASRYRDLPMVGRTHGQHAVPITLGYKFAVWLDELARHRNRLRDMRPRIGVGQLSGAAGTLASLGSEGLRVRQEMCRRLGLKAPTVGWHTARDSLAELGSVLGLVAGTLGKMALEVAALQRNEIGELSEGFTTGRGSSSTMPQKRNPISSEVMIAQSAFVRHQVPLLTYAMTGVHERAMGEWQVEWIVFPQISVMSVGLLKNAICLLENLVVNGDAMRRNLDITLGLIASERVMMALATYVGRQEAHRLVYAASAQAIDQEILFIDALRAQPKIVDHLPDEQLVSLLDPTTYTGSAGLFVDAILEQEKKSLPEQ